MWGYGPYWMMGYGGGPMMLAHSLVWLLLLAFLGVLVVRAFRRSERQERRHWPGLDVLEERYARGEIGRDEFLEKKRDIQNQGTGA